MACLPRAELAARANRAASALARAQTRRFEQWAQRLDRASNQLISPSQRLRHHGERLANLRRRLAHAWDRPQARRHARVALLQEKLIRRRVDPVRIGERLAHTVLRLHRAQAQGAQGRATRVATLAAQLRAFDPQNTLARGYSIVRDPSGNIVRDAALLEQGQGLALTFARGGARVVVSAAMPDE
jgi:exodeoxyribonuclease VII large subunit